LSLDTSALQIFVDVVRRGSFAAVARDRDVDPSIVSRAVKALEDELGSRLFQRTTRRLSLTEAGTVFFDRIAPAIEEIERARDSVAEATATPRGTLRVTTSVSFGERQLVPLLPRFTALYPELAIEVVLTEAVIDLVAERIDVAIRLGQLADTSLVATRLFHTRYVVCASPDYLARHPPIRRPADLEAHECVLFPYWGFRTRWTFRDTGGTIEEVMVRGKLTVSTGISVEACVVAGMGVTILPDWLVAANLKQGKLSALLEDYESTATSFDAGGWLLYPSRERMPLKVRVFADFLRRELHTRRSAHRRLLRAAQ
jgi:DNA-binding transcriptional LysR family regulator